ncbi:hypothetical protein [Niabella beijingensis]|uniref:hypothetical protein n=1 Tax=Niabella beijingensis TaxID=2872700 RepID=UPI001CBB8E3C|nr:hypothetical protein [Niabella beijingensis]MBZ4192592.1 hypothetical protein [Niabella beijingensis]
MRKKIYKLHRVLSLVIALPVLLWAVSGFMHPMMTNLRPQIASQSYVAPGIDTAQLIVPLQQALQQNEVDSFNNVHIVQMGGQQFYQVIIDGWGSDTRYFSTKTGNLLKDGDALYARFLARAFLEGTGNPGYTAGQPEALSDHDCCMMATARIMDSRGAKITGVERITRFDGEYKYINRLLPVYKVAFDRPDGIRIYVATNSGRFGFAVDNRRAAFDRFFGIFHTWEWMNALGTTKYFIMVVITLLGFLTTLLGLYLFVVTKTKRSAHPLVKARRNHRYTSLIASVFTLMFTFSGGYHALEKLLPVKVRPEQLPHTFLTAAVDPDFKKLGAAAGGYAIRDVSLCTMNGIVYWQLYLKKAPGVTESRTDLMKTMTAAMPDVVYVRADDYTVLQKGDERYARYLAEQFRGAPQSADTPLVQPVTKFTEEYGFINKRLPVWRVGYSTNGRERYYIETTTGVLAARIQDRDLAEGYSFAFFHKHHFMDWGGKMTRDISTLFGAAMQIAMVVVGLLLYFRSRRRKQAP